MEETLEATLRITKDDTIVKEMPFTVTEDTSQGLGGNAWLSVILDAYLKGHAATLEIDGFQMFRQSLPGFVQRAYMNEVVLKDMLRDAKRDRDAAQRTARLAEARAATALSRLAEVEEELFYATRDPVSGEK